MKGNVGIVGIILGMSGNEKNLVTLALSLGGNMEDLDAISPVKDGVFRSSNKRRDARHVLVRPQRSRARKNQGMRLRDKAMRFYLKENKGKKKLCAWSKRQSGSFNMCEVKKEGVKSGALWLVLMAFMSFLPQTYMTTKYHVLVTIITHAFFVS